MVTLKLKDEFGIMILRVDAKQLATAKRYYVQAGFRVIISKKG